MNKHNYPLLKRSPHLTRLFLLLAFLVAGTTAVYSQTIATTLANNNGSSIVIGTLENANAGPIIINSINCAPGTSGSQTFQLWTKPVGGFNSGPPGAVSTLNGWTLQASNTLTTTAQTIETGLATQQVMSGLNVSLSPGFYLFCIAGSSIRYSTIGVQTCTFSAGGVTLNYCTSNGYGGTLASPTNSPRGLVGAITFSPSTPCLGTPTPGNTLSSVALGCSGQAFTLSLQNTTSGSGVSYQWQSDNGGGFANIPGAINYSYSATQTVATSYRCVVICAGSPGTSNPIAIGMNTFENCYCNPSYSSGTSGLFYGVISNITLNTLNHNPPGLNAPPYVYSNPPVGNATTTLLTGNSYTLSVSSGVYNGVGVWIDFNQSGTYDASEYFSVSGNNNSTGSAWTGTVSVPVPSGALAGLTGMRVSTAYYCCYPAPITAVDACQSWTYGETEDYKVTIAIPSACAGTPTPGNTESNVATACPATPFTLSLQNTATIGSGVSFQWQSSPDGSTWANISGGTTNPYSTTLSASTYYQCVVTCSNGGGVGTSTPLQVGLNPAYNCFCTATPTNTADEEIYQISINGASTPAAYANTTGCSNTAPGPGSLLSRYSNFTTLGALTTLSPGQTVSFEIRENECDGATYYGNGIGMWIDFNKNGVLTDPGEAVYIETTTSAATGLSPGGDKVITGTFVVPLGAANGLVGVRIIAAEGYSGASLTPCLVYSYGETEDWVVNITGLPANPPAPLEVGVPNCATGGTLTANGTAPSGEVWYWQTTASGTSTAQPATVNLNILANGTYYIRSYNPTYAIWSSGAGSITVTDFPVGPANPVISAPGGNPACGSVTLVSSVAASGTTTYWQGTNPIGTSTASIADDGTNNNPFPAPANGVYYLRARDNTSFCWSNAVSSTVTINTVPTTPIVTATQSSICPGSSTILSAVAPSAPPTGYSVSTLNYATMPSPETTTLANAGPTGDEGVIVANIGFSFNFYGTTYTQVQIHTNGYIVFGSNNYVFGGYSPTGPIPTTTATNNWFGHWADMFASAGEISYETQGIAPNRKFIVNANNLKYYSATPYYSGQIVINELDGSLDIYITHMQTTYTSAIGMEDFTGSAGTAAPGHNNVAVAADFEAWHFAPIQAMGFLWTPNGVGSGIPVGDETLANVTATPTSTTTYTMTITDPLNGCTNSNSVLITALSTPPAPAATGGATLCGTGTVTLTATGSGGTLNWYDAATGGNLVGTGGSFMTPLINSNTTYWVEETNGTCSGPRSSALATYTTAPTVSVASPNPAVCYPGGTAATLNATGGDPNYVYTWSPAPQSTSGAFNQTASVLPASTTVYTVTGTNAGCSAQATISVGVALTPVITAVTANPATVCQGGTSTLDAGTFISNTLTTPMSPNNGSNGNAFNVTATNAVVLHYMSIVSTSSGTAEVWYIPGGFAGPTLTNSAGWILAGTAPIGIGSPALINVDVNISIPAGQTYGVAITSTSSISYTNGTAFDNTWVSDANLTIKEGCGGIGNGGAFSFVNSPRNLNGSISYTSGNPNLNYLWSGPGLSSYTIYNPVATLGAASTTYTVTVTDAGCSTSGSVTLTEPASNPGNTVSSANPVCPSQGFTLSTQFNPPGANYSWQSSPDGITWTDLGSGASTYGAMISTPTHYRASVGCLSSSNFTTPILVNVSSFFDCYCASTAIYTADEEIYQVTLNGASTDPLYANDNGCTAVAPGPGSVLSLYSNFKTLGSLTTIFQGASVPLEVRQNECDGTTYYSAGIAVFIDFNQNGSFADPGEAVYQESGTSAATGLSPGGDKVVGGFFTVPLTALSGNTAMRVIAVEGVSGTNISPCGNNNYGETEDYLINIGDPNCVGIPLFPGNGDQICPDDNLALSWAPKAGAIGYDVYLDANNPNPTTLVSASQSGTTYSVGSFVTTNTYYWKVVPLYSVGSCTTPQVFSYTFKPAPQPTASSNSPVCEGQSVSFFGNNIASGQTTGNSYLWTGPNGFNDIVQNPTLSNATAAASGTYSAIVTNQFGCSSTITTSVTVAPLPALNIQSQTDVSCNGGSDGAFTIEVTNGVGFYLYDQNGNINFDGMFSGFSAGLYIVQVTDGNSCASSIPVTITEPDPTTLPDAGQDQTSCVGTTVTLAGNTAAVGTGTWTVVAGSGTFTNANDPATTVTGVGAGLNTYAWTIDNAVCFISNSDNVNVTTNVLPTATVSGTTSICNGQTANLTLDFTGTGPWTYSYSNGSTTFGPFATSNNPEIVQVSPTVATTYSLVGIDDSNCSGTVSGSASITVVYSPPVGSIYTFTAPTTACFGTIATITTNAVSGATSYTWSGPAGTLFDGQPGPYSSASNSVSVEFGILSTTSGYSICATAVNACGQSNTRCIWIRGTVSTPAPITGSTVGCPNTTGPYSTSTVVGAANYFWTASPQMQIIAGQGTPNVTVRFLASFTSGTICVVGVTSCGSTSTARCMTVNKATSTPGTMSGPFAQCPGQTGQVFSIDPVAGAASYTWTVPANVTLTSGQGTPSITVSVGSTFNIGNICVTATSICGIVSAPRCKTISSVQPNTPGNITGPNAGVCGQSITYSVPAQSGVTSYNWVVPVGATIVGGSGTNTVQITFASNFTTGQLCVTAENGCGSSTARCVNIKGVPADLSVITGPNPVCSYDAGLLYYINPAFGATSYVWTVPAGASIVAGQGTNAIIVDYGIGGGLVTVKAVNGCGQSGTRTLNVIVNCRMAGSLPNATLNAYPNPVSSDLTIDLDATTSGSYVVELLDLSGRIVKSEVMNAIIGLNRNSMDVSTLAKGMYLLNVKNEDGFSQQMRIAVE